MLKSERVTLPPEYGSTGTVELSWRWRHARSLALASLIVIIAGGVEGGRLGNSYADKADRQRRTEHLQAKARAERCLSVVKKNAGPNSKTAIVRLSSLSVIEQEDCDIAFLSEDFETAIQSIPLPMDAKLDTKSSELEVKLPSKNALQETIAEEEGKANASYTHADEIAIGAGLGVFGSMFGVGLIINPRGIGRSFKNAFKELEKGLAGS
jgi:hypothetical protein